MCVSCVCVLSRNTNLRLLTLRSNPIGMPAAVALLAAWRAGGFRGTLDLGECVLSVMTIAVDTDALAAAAAKAKGAKGAKGKAAAKGKSAKKDESPKKGAKKGGKSPKKGKKDAKDKEAAAPPPPSGPGLIAPEIPPVAPLGTPAPTDVEFETLWRATKARVRESTGGCLFSPPRRGRARVSLLAPLCRPPSCAFRKHAAHC